MDFIPLQYAQSYSNAHQIEHVTNKTQMDIVYTNEQEVLGKTQLNLQDNSVVTQHIETNHVSQHPLKVIATTNSKEGHQPQNTAYKEHPTNLASQTTDTELTISKNKRKSLESSSSNLEETSNSMADSDIEPNHTQKVSNKVFHLRRKKEKRTKTMETQSNQDSSLIELTTITNTQTNTTSKVNELKKTNKQMTSPSRAVSPGTQRQNIKSHKMDELTVHAELHHTNE